MGLSSSQARLLNLTSRMHQIEYKAAKLEAEKLQMANESDRVYNEYLDALDKTKIQRKKLTSDGAVTYIDITSYADFNTAGFALVHHNYTFDGTQSGKRSDRGFYYTSVPSAATNVTVPSTIAEKYGISTTGNYWLYDNIDGTFEAYSSALTFPDNTTHTLDWAQLLTDLGIDNPSNDFASLLTNVIQSGEVTIVSAHSPNTFHQPKDAEFHLFETSVSTNTNLQEVKDEVNLKKAEAKYEADMLKIDRKERKYDADLATFDNERNAIKQEMDTLKTVAKENVERTFKLFS